MYLMCPCAANKAAESRKTGTTFSIKLDGTTLTKGADGLKLTNEIVDTTYTAGDGLELTGTTFGIKLDGTTLTKGATHTVLASVFQRRQEIFQYLERYCVYVKVTHVHVHTFSIG
jgi:hypothetical protein